MPQSISMHKSFTRIQQEETELYRLILIAEGMEEISLSDLIDMITPLSYKIDNAMCHNYYNNSNEHNYLARSMHYMDTKTKQSYAHYTQSFSNADNLKQLQKIRRNYFVFDKGRILDL